MKLGMTLANEYKRKVVHMLSGAIFIFVLVFLGRTELIAGLALILLGGLLIINRLFIGWKMPIVGWFINNFERKDVKIPGNATAWYVAGALISATILKNNFEVAAAICALAFGDGLSAMIGAVGKRRLFYNQYKTVEGSVAFFLATFLSAYLFIGFGAFPFAFAMAIVESVPLGIDDNFSIPIAGAVYFMIF